MVLFYLLLSPFSTLIQLLEKFFILLSLPLFQALLILHPFHLRFEISSSNPDLSQLPWHHHGLVMSILSRTWSTPFTRLDLGQHRPVHSSLLMPQTLRWSNLIQVRVVLTRDLQSAHWTPTLLKQLALHRLTCSFQLLLPLRF